MSDAIKFNDGAAYERYMGVWSRAVGVDFLAWLALKPGLRWLDVGCGNGAFTELLAEKSAPAKVHGIDPSEAQLAHARGRPALQSAEFRPGHAMALPFERDSFDAAVMPLVIFFVPEPPKGVAEMARVVAPGGSVSAYVWDIPGGGFPYQALRDEMKSLGHEPPMAPSPDASSLSALRALWEGAGLESVETNVLTVRRTFDGFDDYWGTVQGGPNVSGRLAAMPREEREILKGRMRGLLTPDDAGRITLTARANAVRGRVRG